MEFGRRLFLVAAAVLTAAATISPPVTDAATGMLRATFRGERIALREVRQHHCHKTRHAVIRCFATSAQRDQDLDGRRLSLVAGASSVAYVTFFEHAYYGGSSLTVADEIPHLGTLGWNDAISSFKTLNGRRPKWWSDTYYGGLAWQWSAGAWVSYVGDGANDRFSSVKHVP